MVRARVAKKDPFATNHLGDKLLFGDRGLQKDMRKALELYTEAAELGSLDALYNLGISYDHGEGVEVDEEKGVEFFKKAAMQGHVASRHNLGFWEAGKGDGDRAVRHFLISAKMGRKESLENIKQMFIDGIATKDRYAEALKGYQDAVEETKSNDRDEAKAFYDKSKAG